MLGQIENILNCSSMSSLQEKRGYNDEELKHLEITNWLGERWHIGDAGTVPFFPTI